MLVCCALQMMAQVPLKKIPLTTAAGKDFSIRAWSRQDQSNSFLVISNKNQYLFAATAADTAAWSVWTADAAGAFQEPAVPHAVTLGYQQQLKGMMSPVYEMGNGGVIAFHWLDLRHFAFSELPPLQGPATSAPEQLKLPNREVAVTVFPMNGSFYLLTCDRNESVFHLYRKTYAQPLRKMAFSVSFNEPAGNGVAWGTDYASLRTLMAPYFDFSYSLLDGWYQSGRYLPYAELRRTIKPFVSNSHIHLLIHTGYHASVLFTFELEGATMQSAVFDYRAKKLNDIAEQFPSLGQLQLKPSLGFFARDHSTHMIDTTVVVARAVGKQLLLLYYGAVSGQLFFAEAFDATSPASLFEKRIADVDYFRQPADSMYASAEDYFNMLPGACPEINLVQINAQQLMVSVELLARTRTGSEMEIADRLVERAGGGRKAKPLLSFARVLEKPGVPAAIDALPAVNQPDARIQQLQQWCETQQINPADAVLFYLSGKKYLAVLNRNSSELQIYTL